RPGMVIVPPVISTPRDPVVCLVWLGSLTTDTGAAPNLNCETCTSLSIEDAAAVPFIKEASASISMPNTQLPNCFCAPTKPPTSPPFWLTDLGRFRLNSGNKVVKALGSASRILLTLPPPPNPPTPLASILWRPHP